MRSVASAAPDQVAPILQAAILELTDEDAAEVEASAR
jgi:hypothetical protein